MRVASILLLVCLVCDVSWAQSKTALPAIHTIAEGVVWRKSANDRPSWEQITIANIFGFKKRPVVGESVTVVAIGSDIQPLRLRILSTEEKEDCDKRLRPFWEVKLEPLTQKRFFDVPSPPHRSAEFPFDVVVIYPAVKVAQQIKRDQLKRESLPNGVIIDTVKAAIDLDDDRKPDVVVTQYCCSDKKKLTDECDYVCGKTFKKVGNLWKLVNTSMPC